MASAVFAPPIGPEFDPFLCAFIGADPNGKLLSVLSAFARTDIDPWQEAAYLARMPRESATTRLSEFIAALPDTPCANVPARTIAGQLIALLPARAMFVAPVPPLPGKLADVLSGAHSRLGVTAATILLLVGFICLFWIAPNPPALSPPTTSSAPASTTLGAMAR